MWKLFICLILVAALTTLCVIISSRRRNKDMLYFDKKYGNHKVLQPVSDPKNYFAEDPVDAVITWVDSTCPLWQRAKKLVFKSDEYLDAASNFKEEVRFTSDKFPDSEISLCLSLILRNMPWVRRVFVVTMRPQRPLCLQHTRFADAVEKEKIVIVHHDEIFPDPDAQLPTFNSHAIESCLHRIPGLAEKFLYFNDDFFVVRPLRQSDLYNNGRSLVKTEPLDMAYMRIQTVLAEQGYSCAWINLHKRKNEFGLSNIRVLGHTPNPLTISMMLAAEKMFQAQWRISSYHRIRGLCSEPDIPPIGAAINLALEDNLAVAGQITEYSTCLHSSPQLYQLINENPHVVCLNCIPHEDVGKEIMKMTRWFCPDVPGGGNCEYNRPGFVAQSLMIIAHPDEELLFGVNNGLDLSENWAVLCCTYGGVDNTVSSIIRRNEFSVSMAEHEVHAWKMLDLPDNRQAWPQEYLRWCIETYITQLESMGKEKNKITKIVCHGSEGKHGDLNNESVFQAVEHMVTHVLTTNDPKRIVHPVHKKRLNGLYESQDIKYRQHEVVEYKKP